MFDATDLYLEYWTMIFVAIQAIRQGMQVGSGDACIIKAILHVDSSLNTLWHGSLHYGSY